MARLRALQPPDTGVDPMADILLAIDIQHEASWSKALPQAAAEAKLKGATLHVAVVVPDFGSSMVGQYFPPNFEKDTLNKSAEELTAFCEKHVPSDVTWQAHLGHGDVDHEILRLAEQTGASLIVMASHRPSDMRTFLVGSHADKVVHRSPVSVLVVR
jgi:nucleotide-binding universal stress UspA family protein